MKKVTANINPVEKTADKKEPVQENFAAGLGFYKLFWVFLIGCVAGVIIEVITCLVQEHKIESRAGLIYGPFSPVYGAGAVALTIGLSWAKEKSIGMIFLVGTLLGSSVEYIFSWAQEKLFGTISWEYSDATLNINGRTSVWYAFCWGVLSVAWIKIIYPLLSQIIEKIPNKWGLPLSRILVAFMIADILLSGMAVARQTERRNGIPANDPVRQFLDQHYTDDFLKRIYPNMMFVEEGSPLVPQDEELNSFPPISGTEESSQNTLDESTDGTVSR